MLLRHILKRNKQISNFFEAVAKDKRRDNKKEKTTW